MQNFEIEKLYDFLDSQIKLATAYTEYQNLTQIIKMCRLKPFDMMINRLPSNKLKLHNKWVDENNNALIINKDKSIKIKTSILDKYHCINTDLYQNLSIEKIFKISKLLYFFNGKDEDKLENHIILSFLGIDNFLRTFVYVYGKWECYPSLFLGLDVLSKIVDNANLKYYTEVTSEKTVVYPCQTQEEWISSLPIQSGFISILENKSSYITQLLNIKE